MCDVSQEKIAFEGLGKFTKGKGCLYIKKLEDIDLAILEKILKTSISLTVRRNQ